MRICVVGLGKIGLPLAVQYASKGHDVVGADVNPSTVACVAEGREPFPGEADLAERLQAVVREGSLQATTDTTQAVRDSDAVVLVVPVFIDADGTPDFSMMDSATQSVAQGLRAGTLVSYETTLPVGATRQRYAPMLERGSTMAAGEHFDLVFSPERVFTGRVFADLRRYPKLVGGVTAASERRGVDFYEQVLDFDDRPDLPRPNGVWGMGGCEAAEMAKLAETTYRDVNIGLANQFARFADMNGIDLYKVIDACNSQPFSHIHKPGVAVGGHCIPIYPRLYLFNDPDATVVRAAREANAQMPAYAVDLLESHLGNLQGTDVVVLGAAYRGGVKETAFSGVFSLVEVLRSKGATVRVHDPLYSDEEIRSFGWDVYRPGETAEAIVVQADHAEYAKWTSSTVPGVKVLLDGRAFIDAAAWPQASVIAIGGGPYA